MKSFNLKKRIVDAYGGKCACCGERHIEFLTIDHVFNDGKVHREELQSMSGDSRPRLYKWLVKNNFPKDRFQLLCMNCNFHKRFGDRPCVHDKRYKEWFCTRVKKAKLWEKKLNGRV